MIVTPHDRVIARHMFDVALGLVERNAADEADRQLARSAMRNPGATTLRPLLSAGQGKPWLASVVDALAEVGVAAADDIIGSGSDDQAAERSTRTKWELTRATVFALERAGIVDQSIFADEIGEPRDHFVRMMHDRQVSKVALERITEIYDIAADKTGWWPLHVIIRDYCDEMTNG